MACARVPTPNADLLRLVSARKKYSPTYDEAFDEVRRRIATANSATKLDLAALACWKRIRCDTPWVQKLHELPQAQVTGSTQEAFANGLTPADRVAALRIGLKHGMGGAFSLGSALLTAWNPVEYAVTDRRARASLAILLRPLGCSCDFGSYPTYLNHVVDLRDELRGVFPAATVTARDVDQALFHL